MALTLWIHKDKLFIVLDERIFLLIIFLCQGKIKIPITFLPRKEIILFVCSLEDVDNFHYALFTEHNRAVAQKYKKKP